MCRNSVIKFSLFAVMVVLLFESIATASRATRSNGDRAAGERICMHFNNPKIFVRPHNGNGKRKNEANKMVQMNKSLLIIMKAMN